MNNLIFKINIRYPVRVLAGASLALLSGCAAIQEYLPKQSGERVAVERVVPNAQNAAPVDRAISQFATGPARKVEGATMNELAALRDHFRIAATEDARLALATALALNSSSDERELATLIDPLLRDDNPGAVTPSSPSVRAYALILESLSSDRRLLKETRAQLANKAKDTQLTPQQAQRVSDAQTAKAKAELRVDELQARVDTLQKKLDRLCLSNVLLMFYKPMCTQNIKIGFVRFDPVLHSFGI
jgi:hypothetical protein